jgi:hypothetical protein
MLSRSLLSRWPTPRIALLVTVFVACESGGAESTTEPFGHDPNGPQDVPPAGSGDGATMRPGSSKSVADVVIVMLGGNDFAIGQPVDHGPASAAEFTSAYSTFTAVLRQRYPSAHLFLTVPPPLTDLDPPGTNTRSNVVAAVKSVAAQRNSSGDPKVHAFEPKPGDESEHTGCEGHGSPQFHQRVAAELAVEVASKVGWN